jgi:hypothetical protein
MPLNGIARFWKRSAGASKTQKPSIILPLYIYPDPGGWDPLFDA